MDTLLEAALIIETYKFPCRFCQRRFSLKSNCVRHERIHTNDKPHECRICSKRFILKKNMQEHERVHTLERPFQCEQCSRKFSRCNSLTRHSRIHTGEKPYSCNHCHKTFAWKTYLKRHFLKAHVNEANKMGHEEDVPDSALVGGAEVPRVSKSRRNRVRPEPRIEVTSANTRLTEVNHTEKVGCIPAQRAKNSTAKVSPAKNSTVKKEIKEVIVRIPRTPYSKELEKEERYKLEPMTQPQFKNLITKKLSVRVARFNAVKSSSNVS